MNYYSLNRYLQDTFGEKVYKIALDGGFSCPNRDGTLGNRGCIFCSGAGSGEFAGNRRDSVTVQIEKGKELLKEKVKGRKYIAYFQAFTNTYGPAERLRKLYEEAISHPDIAALSIATRPDCLSEEVILLLQEMNRKKPVWVELGLQTIHERTARYIRRGYPLSVYDAAVEKLKRIPVHVIVHVILGLPGETKKEMKETVSYVGASGADGIKLQLLHVIKGTDLEKEYREGKCRVMELEEYALLVADCIALLPERMVIHRMTGDGDKKTLIAPEWSRDKKRVLNTLQRAIAENGREKMPEKGGERKHILFLEDDASIASGLLYAMEQEGYSVTHCKNVCAAHEKIKDIRFDLALLDMQLPDGSGKEIGKKMKALRIPVIYLTIVDDEDEIVEALEEGAADYIIKPFRLREVLTRIKRNLQKEREGSRLLKLGGVSIDADAGKVFAEDKPVTLTALEYRLLLIFAENQGILLTRQQLLERIWDIGGEFVEDNTLTVYVRRLRQKLGDALPITTVRGIGYRVDQ